MASRSANWYALPLHTENPYELLWQVSHSFGDTVKNNPSLAYRLELAAAGMTDCSSSPLDIHARRELLKAFRHGWFDFTQSHPSVLMVTYPKQVLDVIRFDSAIVQISCSDAILFARGPSYLNGVESRVWHVETGFSTVIAIVRPEQDLLVVVRREDTGSVSPFCLP